MECCFCVFHRDIKVQPENSNCVFFCSLSGEFMYDVNGCEYALPERNRRTAGESVRFDCVCARAGVPAPTG